MHFAAALPFFAARLPLGAAIALLTTKLHTVGPCSIAAKARDATIGPASGFRLWLCLASLLLLAPAPPAGAQLLQKWVARYDNGQFAVYPLAVLVDGAGDVVVTGSTDGPGSISPRDFYTAKYRGTDGTLLWQNLFAGPGGEFDAPASLAVDSTGNVIITGQSTVFENRGRTFTMYSAMYAAADGHLMWEKFYHKPGIYDFALGAAVAVGAGNSLFLAGSASPQNSYDADFFLTKLGAGGNVLWERYVDGPTHEYDSAQSMALDAGGNALVTGYTTSTYPRHEYMTVKFRGTDGVRLWSRTYGLPAYASKHEATAVAVDAGGNAIVTGHSEGTAGDDFYTAKYAAANGALLWEKRYDGPGHGNDVPAGVALDKMGNVFVTGTVTVSEIDRDYYTAKYAAANGALIWEKKHGSAIPDGATGLVIDGDGDVIITGTCSPPGSFDDFCTLKYSGIDGRLLWELHFNGSNNASYDYAQSVALGAGGGVVVTGSSSGGFINSSDGATVFYALPNARESWRLEHFHTVSNAGESADDADPDADGIVNLVEWACGSSPVAAGPPNATAATDGPVLLLSFSRSIAAAAAGTSIAVEWSDTLSPGDWHTDGIIETVLSNDGLVEQVRAAFPAAPKRFARLRVTVVP